MTTIAYRDGIMAADSAVSDNGTIVGSVQKIARAPDGSLGAASGSLGASTRFREWVQTGMETEFDAKEDNFSALLVRSSGFAYHVDRFGAQSRLQGSWFVEGSGQAVAMGAMANGADAVRAVRIACEYDTGSRGPVQIEELNSVKPDEPL